MLDDWAAVARAINERTHELGMPQRELAERSGVSQAIVREIQRQTVHRRRSARTLEALSLALDWHPGHLAALLHGRTPLQPGETGDEATDRITERLSAIEDRLDEITTRLDGLSAQLETVTERMSDTEPKQQPNSR